MSIHDRDLIFKWYCLGLVIESFIHAVENDLKSSEGEAVQVMINR